ncbi:MAG: thioesterase family protein [Gammaproteobacteria bacterium]|nr:thioesterase family protein [Gammaproteobacteria bacterium]
MNLYLRLIGLLLSLPFIEKKDVFAVSVKRFRAWPLDCDLNMHVTNSRYLALADLGRTHLLAQMKLLRSVLKRRWLPVLHAVALTFVRPIPPLVKFELHTRLLTWDEKYFYVEQKFIYKGHTCTVGLFRGLFVKGRETIPVQDVIELAGEKRTPPPKSEVLEHWNAMREAKRAESQDS